jgi:hypothetical protein
MTLKEKFDKIEVNIEEGLSGIIYLNDIEAEECEQVAEDFAIGFMKWFYENAYLIEWLSNDHKREQLLKAYKKTL